MFRSTNELRGYKVLATDGDCGTVQDFLFDDDTNIVRYLVVDTGDWLTDRQVLVSPVAIEQPDLDSLELPTVLSKANIEAAPLVETDQPVSRQYESALTTFYNWPVYWGNSPAPILNHSTTTVELKERVAAGKGDPHLRSVSEVTGYNIQCMEDTLGHVEDIIVDTESWSLRYLVIDTRNWLPGKKVIIAFDWITHFTWENQKAHVDLTREQVENAPLYDPRLPVNRAYETQLYDFYGRPTYW
ncbi:PRC-barrel domain-containing protein [Gimesia sp.]|uniref:PRC-barrel domain-containing protein n=1 Tax=Gimesia sp. TaxID=2024833 RepID=UPI003A8E02FB